MKKYSSIEEAVKGTLKEIKENGHFTFPRNRPSIELLGHNFIIENPRNRLVGFEARKLNFYFLGFFLWVMRQSNKLDFIKYYNPRGSMFSDDGEILRGAYGKRIFDFDGVNQWHQVVKELKSDRESRRAIITFHLPQHDWHGSLDTPCTASVQFFIRDEKLHMINHMRSQSAAFVLPYDIFLMTMLQELLAIELGAELGYYQHFCGSIHYFENEEEMVDKIISSEDYISAMPEMPKEDNMMHIRKLLEFEEVARLDAIKTNSFGSAADHKFLMEYLSILNLPKYWHYFGEALIAKALQFSNSKYYNEYVKNLNNNPFQKVMLNLIE